MRDTSRCRIVGPISRRFVGNEALRRHPPARGRCHQSAGIAIRFASGFKPSADKASERIAGAARATVYKHFALRKISLEMLSTDAADAMVRLRTEGLPDLFAKLWIFILSQASQRHLAKFPQRFVTATH